MSLPDSFPYWPQCPDCMAYTPNLEAHRCPEWIKELVRMKRERDAQSKMTPDEQYRFTEDQLLKGREDKTLTDDQDEALLEKLGILWYALTESEQKAARERAAAWAASH